MKMPVGKYKGLEISTLPHDYLLWIVDNFDDGEIKNEAKKVLGSSQYKQDQQYKSLEEQANEILGERPIGLIRRGPGRFKKRL